MAQYFTICAYNYLLFWIYSIIFNKVSSLVGKLTHFLIYIFSSSFLYYIINLFKIQNLHSLVIFIWSTRDNF